MIGYRKKRSRADYPSGQRTFKLLALLGLGLLGLGLFALLALALTLALFAFACAAKNGVKAGDGGVSELIDALFHVCIYCCLFGYDRSFKTDSIKSVIQSIIAIVSNIKSIFNNLIIIDTTFLHLELLLQSPLSAAQNFPIRRMLPTFFIAYKGPIQ